MYNWTKKEKFGPLWLPSMISKNDHLYGSKENKGALRFHKTEANYHYFILRWTWTNWIFTNSCYIPNVTALFSTQMTPTDKDMGHCVFGILHCFSFDQREIKREGREDQRAVTLGETCCYIQDTSKDKRKWNWKVKKKEIQGKKLPEKFHLVKMMIFPIFVLQTLNIMLWRAS